jgi:hypothetical protein
VDRARTEALLGRLREAIPKLAMRTTFIVGFPGETDAEFEELREFLVEAKFERCGVFPYSLEPDTPAAITPSPASRPFVAFPIKRRTPKPSMAKAGVACAVSESMCRYAPAFLLPPAQMPVAAVGGRGGVCLAGGFP